LAENLDVDVSRGISEHEDALLLRFLRARKFVVSDAFAMLEADVSWRVHVGVEQIRLTSPADILGCAMRKACGAMPIHHHGYDKQGRPVLIQQVGGYNVDALEKVGDSGCSG
jgi:hypothetical protein